jgi:hypothetical protein
LNNQSDNSQGGGGGGAGATSDGYNATSLVKPGLGNQGGAGGTGLLWTIDGIIYGVGGPGGSINQRDPISAESSTAGSGGAGGTTLDDIPTHSTLGEAGKGYMFAIAWLDSTAPPAASFVTATISKNAYNQIALTATSTNMNSFTVVINNLTTTGTVGPYTYTASSKGYNNTTYTGGGSFANMSTLNNVIIFVLPNINNNLPSPTMDELITVSLTPIDSNGVSGQVFTTNILDFHLTNYKLDTKFP